MTYHHTIHYIVAVTDGDNGDTATWYIGPFGHNDARYTATHLETLAHHLRLTRSCQVHPLHIHNQHTLPIKTRGPLS